MPTLRCNPLFSSPPTPSHLRIHPARHHLTYINISPTCRPVSQLQKALLVLMKDRVSRVRAAKCAEPKPHDLICFLSEAQDTLGSLGFRIW